MVLWHVAVVWCVPFWHGHTALQMFNIVTDMLNRLGIAMEDLRGQSYDNASNL